MSRKNVNTFRANTNKDTEKSIYDMSTRELRKRIREATKQANDRIAKYRKQNEPDILTERVIKSVKEATAAPVRGKRMEYKIPRGYKKGELGLGLSYKTKNELQRQLGALNRFLTKDINTPDGEKEWSDKVNRQYETFMENTGEYMTKDEYMSMIDIMNVVKEMIKDYGYEQIGGDIANKYAEANAEGKRKFVYYVDRARRESSGKSAEELVDKITEYLVDAGEI